MLSLEQVRTELTKYHHPLFHFVAEEDAHGSVVLFIRLAEPREDIHEYRLVLHERDVAGSQFSWNLQRLLYACLHDFVAEMFTRTPQMREDRQ